MTKRHPLLSFSLVATAAVMLLTGCSDNGSSSAAQSSADGKPEYPVTWRFALEEIEGSVQHLYAQQFREQVEALSGGRIEVDVFPYGSLGTSAQLTELTRNGSVNLAFASPGHLADTVPETGLFNLHFLLPEEQEPARRLLEAPEFISAFEPAYHNAGLQLLGFVPEGWMTWTANNPLRTPADFHGLRFRTMTSETAAEAFRSYGADPVQTPFAQVYSDLQLGNIDGQSNPVFAIEEMGFHEVQNVMTMARASRFIASVVANEDWFAGLPSQERIWLEETIAQLSEEAWTLQEDLNKERLETILEQGGIRVVRLTEDERAAFRDASLPARQRFIELTGEKGQALIQRATSIAGD
ncbi:TRAP transporter substrate-binding protein DctP [Marinobacter nauticus]|uniref:TRAP-type C4-dicarboxylate transport system substrate-binding protein n=2 Tax=Marinobacter TaxID=2742 RepID=A0A368V194_MARNT|nr:TRAP transporter substrate-binding protein DctP [Marinobacter nauticus]RBP72527.1 TRAP-type C4-dicarboxylate transport system substrate-binding protein [Marinobacter nauticus]RCW33454.1 TRAP-type C4-dicarboxylate transport system substrate-binding protein [Marinobacter nauticus]